MASWLLHVLSLQSSLSVVLAASTSVFRLLCPEYECCLHYPCVCLFILPMFLEPEFVTAEDVGGFDDLWSSYGFYNEGCFEKGAPLVLNDQQLFSDFAFMDDMHFDSISSAISVAAETDQPASNSELLQLDEKSTPPLPSKTSELLSKYQFKFNARSGEKPNESIERGGSKLSTEDFMRIAASFFIQLSTHKDCNPFMLNNQFGLSFSGLSSAEIMNVELAILLFSAAEKVSQQRFDHGTNLIKECYKLCSKTGNSVQRVVYYFADALQERIHGGKGTVVKAQEVMKALLSNHPVHLATFRSLPLEQIMQFTSVQTILDNLGSAKKIHLIDLSIKHGLQWTILMQALSNSSSVDYVKISAVGTSEEEITSTGKRLTSFAEILKLPFVFKPVIVSDIKELKEDMFKIEETETIALYSSMDMNTMIIKPDRLENVMKVIRNLRPQIVTVVDVEAKHNSRSFINRFTEALFYFSAFFDCLENCMRGDERVRMIVEEDFFSPGISSIVAAEGSERVIRQVGIDVWRLFFARYGLVEAELNQWSVYQASLLVKHFACGESYSFEVNGKALLVGWKGTPLHFISAWKFQ
ncbi:DELLA protein RGL1-like isoform X1 [Ananas comosus]|nr:DELLA protein RGL1-like isoform X1 [Ananas comosus]